MMKTLMTVLFLVCFSMVMNAQMNITWKGGTPGATHEWDNPKNWTPNRVPTGDDLVTIPDCATTGAFYPVLDHSIIRIAHLRIEGNARLTVKSGAQLIIDGSNTYQTGLTLIGTLLNEGQMVVRDAGLEYLDQTGGRFINQGAFLEEHPMNQAVAGQ